MSKIGNKIRSKRGVPLLGGRNRSLSLPAASFLAILVFIFAFSATTFACSPGGGWRGDCDCAGEGPSTGYSYNKFEMDDEDGDDEDEDDEDEDDEDEDEEDEDDEDEDEEDEDEEDEDEEDEDEEDGSIKTTEVGNPPGKVVNLTHNGGYSYYYNNTSSTWFISRIYEKSGPTGSVISDNPDQSGTITTPTNISHITFCLRKPLDVDDSLSDLFVDQLELESSFTSFRDLGSFTVTVSGVSDYDVKAYYEFSPAISPSDQAIKTEDGNGNWVYLGTTESNATPLSGFAGDDTEIFSTKIDLSKVVVEAGNAYSLTIHVQLNINSW